MHRRISAEDLRRMLGEDQITEHKSSMNQRREACETLCGMVNADTGRGQVIFGVSPSGAPLGLGDDLDQAQLSLKDHIRDKFDPRLIVEMEIWVCDGKSLLSVRATRTPETPLYQYGGRAFLREGSSTRTLRTEEIISFVKRRTLNQHPGPWRCNRCGSIVGTFEIPGGSPVITAGPGGGVSIGRSRACGCGGEFLPA